MSWNNLGLTSALAIIGIAASLSLPSTSLAHDPMYPKIGFHFRLAVGGELEGRGGGGPTQRSGMEPGFGGGVELEIPLNPTFSLGGAVEAYGWTVGRASDSYNVSVDFLFMPRVRIPFGDHPWHAEVYFGLPIGPSVSLPHNRFAESVGAVALETGVGVTGGGRVGLRANVNDIVGFFVDVGPMLQYVSYPSRAGGPSFDLWNYQFVIRAGGSFGVGG
ncbi:MAG: hypothetical protein J0L92_05450 [Deltaproteobacteria bacterium]|nr:hypothetical protein [Deltaproteobacteria bacterium]